MIRINYMIRYLNHEALPPNGLSSYAQVQTEGVHLVE